MKAHVKRCRWLTVSTLLLVSFLVAGCLAANQQNQSDADPQSQPVSSDTDLNDSATSRSGGVVVGRVTDPSGSPLAEATVNVSRGTAPVPEMTVITSADGAYQWNLPAGAFTLETHKDGFVTAVVEVTVAVGETITQDIVLQPR